nr:beta-defensin 129 [Cavia porcellus]
MKLLFPIFAGLMLQYHANTEFLIAKRCLSGYGKCKNQCDVDEKEVQKCKQKKCCLGSKVVRMINIYLRKQIPHIPKEEVLEMLSNKNFSIETEINHILPLLAKSTGFFPSVSSDISTKDARVNSVTTSNRGPEHTLHAAAFTNNDTKQRREPANFPTPPPSLP